jgi:2-aminoethylphosphonate-pyruvate transaminase
MTTREPLLFTPGPVTTSATVKQAMLRDAGSWHADFNKLVAGIREELLSLAGVSRADGWETVLVQGSGTFAVEAVFQTCVPRAGKVVVLANGAYGERIAQMLVCARIDHLVLRTAEDAPNDPAALDALLAADPAVTHVAMVHCETTTGLLNPIREVGAVVKRHRKCFIVDSMSGFVGMPIDFEACGIDLLISSANKCIEGTPGFAFVIGKRAALLANEKETRSLSLDLAAQLRGFEKEGKFRYTPPTHAILAFARALRELEMEGGIAGRNARYRQNHEILQTGMSRLNFQAYLNPALQSPIITAYHHPSDRPFSFDQFYHDLSALGFIIYPGKLTKVDTFRIANIGHIFPGDIRQLLSAIEIVMRPDFGQRP